MINILTRLPSSAAKLAIVPALAALLIAVPVAAQETHLQIGAASYGATRSIELEMNKSMLIDLPAGVAEVIVSQPNIAAAIMRTRTRAILQGIGPGSTNVFFLDDAGRTIAVLDLDVAQQEPEQVQTAMALGNALQSTIARVIPGSNIRVDALSNSPDGSALSRFVLTGTVLTAQDKAIAESLAADLGGGGSGESLIQVIGPQQVMLQVTVSEIRRDVAKQMGINLSGTVTIGGSQLGFNNDFAGLPPNGVSGNFPIGDVNIDASIRALEERGALRLLAQPTLTAMSGQPADFLVGGEVQYLREVQDDGDLIYDVREYGVRLAFTPVVKTGNVVSLTVDTEVSEPTANNLLTKREASTSVELPAGTTLAIGGLMSNRVSQGVEQLPGLGNIPILGALFRSREYQSQETELVIMVTPYLVTPGPANTYPLPTNHVEVASDAEAIFLGKMERLYGVAGSGEMRGGFSGSVGFVLE